MSAESMFAIAQLILSAMFLAAFAVYGWWERQRARAHTELPDLPGVVARNLARPDPQPAPPVDLLQILMGERG